MILVTTAGKVGAEAARLLAARGEPVRVLVRDPEKATALALAEAGAEVAQGDLEVPATIDAAMQGVSAVLLVSPAIPAQELSVVDSAVRAGAGHVVKITSKASADSPIARRRGQSEIEHGLIASGLGYTLLRNSAYMQNLLMAMVDIGLPRSLAAMNAQAVALFAEGDSDYVTDDVRSILGRPARTFEQFAANYAAAFS
jgi:uncharacterized protein YbjT (DUF2867 family)